MMMKKKEEKPLLFLLEGECVKFVGRDLNRGSWFPKFY